MTTIPYDAAVTEAREIWSWHEKDQWRLGEIAYQLEPKYGEKTLKRFADEIGIPYKTLSDYRTTFRKWTDCEQSRHQDSRLLPNWRGIRTAPRSLRKGQPDRA